MQLQSVSSYDPYAYLKARETEQIKKVNLEQHIRYLEEAPSQTFGDVLNSVYNASNANDLPVADFSKRVEFDTATQYAIKYYNSCFDFTNEWDFDELTAGEDFTGMSNAEKYKAIYEKYQHCYGENFLEADAVDYYLIPTEYDHWTPVIHRFYDEVDAACGGDKNAREARKDALYGEDLSDKEVRQIIIDKYVHNGEITNRNYLKMTNEMDLCGIGGGIHTSNTFFGRGPSNVFDELRVLREWDPIEAREPTLDCNMTKSDFDDIVKHCHLGPSYCSSPAKYGDSLQQIIASLSISRPRIWSDRRNLI